MAHCDRYVVNQDNNPRACAIFTISQSERHLLQLDVELVALWRGCVSICLFDASVVDNDRTVVRVKGCDNVFHL